MTIEALLGALLVWFAVSIGVGALVAAFSVFFGWKLFR